MRKTSFLNLFKFKLFVLFSLTVFLSNSQTIQVEVIGDAVVTQGSTITINAGSSLDFRITNIDGSNCKGSKKLKIKDIDISNTVDFDISPNNPKKNIKQITCGGNSNKKKLDFEIENISGSCATVSTLVTIEIKNQSDFTFTLEVNSSPEIFVSGGSPLADISHGDTTTSDDNATYFGVVDEGSSVTRAFIVSNIGNCDLDVTGVSSSNPDFLAYSPYGLLPPDITVGQYDYTVIYVTFTAPVAGTGTQSSVISINNSDNTTFTFTVSAEMFNYSIPGPGGITADFRLWLKTTRGITETASKVSEWKDVGTNGKDAIQPVSANQPTYIDTATDNINFNPVIKFENDGATLEEYMYNTTNGFYSQDVFIVMIPDATMTSASTRNTIFAGVSSGSAGDMTGIGFGDYSSEFTNETLSYNQDIPGGGNYNGEAEISTSYSNAGIINIRNNAFSSPTGQDILYNSTTLTTTSVDDIGFVNVGASGPPTLGTEYWVGRNFDVQGSLNGRVAEIFTFAERVTDVDRQKIESYLGLKYGITLGASTEAQKDYVNSFNTSVWDITANAGYNHHVAGIGRDSISDLNQKQSKTLNLANDVSIGLGGVFDTNTTNIHEFKEDGDFLVWGNNNAAYTGTSTNTITVASGITTTLTRIDRKWKIVETNENVNGDVENVYVSIPSAAFSSFTKTATEEYALIVADNSNFANADIIDVIPLRSDGGSNLETWYDFDGTKFFTFGKTPKLSENHSVSIASGDYLVGESALNLNVDYFTISAWVKNASTTGTRTIMAKGEKLQLRLNSSEQIEVMIDDVSTPKFTSTMQLNDGKWHQVTFVYDSGTIYLYIDGVLDKSVNDVVHPSPNYNNFSIGAVYIDKDSITNPFLGEIDEVYIWDVGLSEDQVKYLMNQEVERFDISGVDYVDGKVLPQASTSNEVGTITWSHLRVYYDFNSFYGSTVEGLTDDRYFLRLKYLDKDKALIDDQTIPVPYVSAASGAWDTGTTWSNNSDQVIPNSLSLDGTTIIDWNIVEISHDITSEDRDISLLGLIQTTGKLTIADPVVTFPVENNTGQALYISHYLELDGVIDLVGESQLIQDEGSIVDVDSGGYIERDQQGTANGFNYNFWSSSVGAIGGNSATRGTGVASTNPNHTISEVLKNGTDSDSYDDITFDASANASAIPPPGFTRTISTYWMYQFYGPYNDYNAWAKIDETTSLYAGEGFTMKGTSGSAPITDLQNYVFKGLPNNGDITLELDKSSTEVERLIGNPYPSAIDATEFILDNMSIADGGNNSTGTIFNGALYFWDHFGEENSHNLGNYVGGYATRNLTGGAVAISNDSRVNNTSDNGSAAIGTKVPGDYIAVNQGFFVSTALEGFNNDNGVAITTVDGGDIVFKNSQRVFAAEDGSTSLFFKSSNKKTTKSVSNKETSKIKLLYDSPSGYHRQIVLGTNKKATVNFDMGYDAFMADVNVEDMYWVLNKSKLVIQGVDRFNATQEFPLGVIVKKAGVASIKVDVLENIDNSTSIFIKDTFTGEAFKINNEAFNVYLEPGIYDDRFELVYQQSGNNKLLSIDEGVNEGVNDVIVYYNNEASEIKIINKDHINILDVHIHNILGQSITHIKSNTTSDITIPVNVIKGVYLVKINTRRGLIGKKITSH